MLKARLLFVLLALGLASCEDSSVVVLTDSNYESAFAEDPSLFWFVSFYAPWCTHCNSFAPVWEEFAVAMKGRAKVAKVDATANSAMKSQYEIKGFPSLKAIRGPNVYTYSGKRDLTGMSAFVKKMNAPPLCTVAGLDAGIAVAVANVELTTMYGMAGLIDNAAERGDIGAGKGGTASDSTTVAGQAVTFLLLVHKSASTDPGDTRRKLHDFASIAVAHQNLPATYAVLAVDDSDDEQVTKLGQMIAALSRSPVVNKLEASTKAGSLFPPVPALVVLNGHRIIEVFSHHTQLSHDGISKIIDRYSVPLLVELTGGTFDFVEKATKEMQVVAVLSSAEESFFLSKSTAGKATVGITNAGLLSLMRKCAEHEGFLADETYRFAFIYTSGKGIPEGHSKYSEAHGCTVPPCMFVRAPGNDTYFNPLKDDDQDMAVPDSLTAMQLFLSQIRVGKVEAKGKGALNGYWGAFIQAYVAFAGFAQVHMGIFSAGTLLLGFVLGMTFYHLAFGAGSHTEPGIVQDKKLN